jgi:transcription initiation factor IIF auxiliary subunit
VSLKIKQDAIYKGEDWWKWSVWIDGDVSELDAIDYVQYTLHHTFARPVRKVSDRSSQFRLDSSGWGTFMLYAKVVSKDGGSVTLQHELQLYYPNGDRTLA